MQINYLSIRNFRGIRELDWAPKIPMTCLIGPGDSTKTTILDAIEYALYPHWTVGFDDSDFYNCDLSKNIEITISVSHMPKEFYSESGYGENLRGWSKRDKQIIDEPLPDCADDEILLSIKLSVDENLEPEWCITNERLKDKILISHKKRQNLGITRIGSEINRHLSWGRDSALTKLSENIKDAGKVLIEANRLLREKVTFKDIQGFNNTIKEATESSGKFGVKPVKEFRPNLDSKAISFGFGAISLYDGIIPLRNFGLGTRKLLTTAIQIKNTTDGAIFLIDEIENGLEPYRIRGFLRNIKQFINNGHAIFTSHSPISVVELGAEHLTIVRNIEGKTICLEPSLAINGTIRLAPEALLSKRVIVCEGATEYGILIALENYWTKFEDTTSFAYNGVSTVDGHGSTFEEVTINLKRLMYETAAFVDSDTGDHDRKVKNLSSEGIKLIDWGGRKCLEDQVFCDLPWESLPILIELAAKLSESNLTSLYVAIRDRLSNGSLCTEDDISIWRSRGITEEEIRSKIATVASKKGWFKTVSKGIELGEVICKYYTSIEKTRLREVIEDIKKWVYAET